jgi:DNA-binding transcriptional LysR family regulator
MDLRHLRYFVAVAEEGSFTRAAERLWIAQSGLSQQILALERELGVGLLTRLSRGVELTDAGRLFLEKARLTINAAEDAQAVARCAESGLVGNLRLGLSWQCRYGAGPVLLRAFALDRPGVDLEVVEAQSGTLAANVRDQRLDAAIVVAPERAMRGVAVLDLSLERAGVAMAQDHPLARRAGLAPADLAGETFVISGDRGAEEEDGATRRLLDELGVEHELRTGGYGFAMLEHVRDGGALLLDPHPALAGNAGLVWRPLRPAPGLRFEVIWGDAVQSGPLRAFVETCRRERAGAPFALRGAGGTATREPARFAAPAAAGTPVAV